MTELINIAAMAFVGLIVGSFMNVVVYRLPIMIEHRHSETWNIAWPPSHCPHCQHRLSVRNTIPLFSWLWQRGRCQACAQPISWRYPLTELACSCVFALSAAFVSSISDAIAIMTLFWFIFALAQIDLRTYLLPDVLTQPLLWLGLLYHSVYDREMLPDALYGAVAGYLTLWLVWWGCKILAGKEGIGLGDAKLLAAMGAWCGWPALPPILLAASLLGIVWWLILRLTRRTSIPLIAFGPWFGLAGWLIFSAQSSGVIGY
ncbi:A24 family peptidase [Citrobacter braakii]|uniref:prepilin peptidase n=1 Tax=Citrobacter braakii TaxID=57706 RepID=UPI002430FE21|nr:A24 family peptidase [Citrobacter braakii]WFW78289.1 A24 family peptidase [Citrobacter braakii]